MKHLAQRLFSLSLLSICLLSSSVKAENFTIDTFDSDITIQDDGSLHIVENITVNFGEPRHGIFRVIPQQYKKGNTHKKLILSNIVVNYHYTGYSENGNYIIKIGDPDVLIGGKQQYTIDYVIGSGIIDYNNHKALYRNILDERPVSIGKVSFSVTLPPNHKDKHSVISIGVSSQNKDSILIEQSGGIIKGYIDNLSPNTPVTIKMNIRKKIHTSGNIGPSWIINKKKKEK